MDINRDDKMTQKTSGGDGTSREDSRRLEPDDKGGASNTILEEMAEEHRRHMKNIKTMWEAYQRRRKPEQLIGKGSPKATTSQEGTRRKKKRQLRPMQEATILLDPIAEEGLDMEDAIGDRGSQQDTTCLQQVEVVASTTESWQSREGHYAEAAEWRYEIRINASEGGDVSNS